MNYKTMRHLDGTPSHPAKMLFYSFFKTLVGKQVTVELKNDMSITGQLESVDQFLNLKLSDISIADEERYPHMLSVKNCFVRGSVIRYVSMLGESVDTDLLQDAARREAAHVAAQKTASTAAS